jgi:ABC transporter
VTGPTDALHRNRRAADREGDVLFDGEAPVAGRTRRVRCVLQPDVYRIEIEGAGVFAVARCGGAVTVLGGGAALAAALAGPPLALGFALRDVFCLHASAVEREGRAIAFLGESGAGKSTLARLLAGLPDGGWRRLADDLLPVALSPGGPEARPRFPQPGLAGAAAAALPERLPLAAVYVLAGPAGEVAITPLAGRAGALALVRHTVAARLFAADLLARHLEHAAAVAAAAPVRVLTYPWTADALPAVAAALAAALAERRDG